MSDLVELLEEGRRRELEQALFYRLLAGDAEMAGEARSAERLNELLAEMLKTGCTHCFMEVSSHAIDQERVAGLEFSGAIFTNISHDHLDYHKTFDAYIAAKKKLFDGLPDDAFALINKDDKRGILSREKRSAVRAHKWVDYVFDRLDGFRVFGDQRLQDRPVNSAVNHGLRQCFHKRWNRCATLRIELMDGGIRIPDRNPFFREHPSGGRLAHSD